MVRGWFELHELLMSLRMKSSEWTVGSTIRKRAPAPLPNSGTERAVEIEPNCRKRSWIVLIEQAHLGPAENGM